MKKILFRLHFINFTNQAILIALMLAPSIYGSANNDEKGKKLINAVIQGDLDTVKKELIKDKANVNATYNSNTALMLAAFYGQTEIIEELLKAGANIDAKNVFGETALMLAAKKGRIEATKKLFTYGADAYIENNDGSTAVDLASNKKISEIMKQPAELKNFFDKWGMGKN